MCEPPVIQPSGGILIMPGIRARYSGWGLVEAQATRCQLLLQERPEAKTVQKLKPGHHPDPFRDKAKTSDNLCPQMRFIIHGEGQEQRPPVLTQPSYQQRGLARAGNRKYHSLIHASAS